MEERPDLTRHDTTRRDAAPPAQPAPSPALQPTPWWTCTHEDGGLPGCPTCDAAVPDAAHGTLLAAREEIRRLVERCEALRRLAADAHEQEQAAAQRNGQLLRCLLTANNGLRVLRGLHEATVARLDTLIDAADPGRAMRGGEAAGGGEAPRVDPHPQGDPEMDPPVLARR